MPNIMFLAVMVFIINCSIITGIRIGKRLPEKPKYQKIVYAIGIILASIIFFLSKK